MTNGNHLGFLDVGYCTKPKGDVNVDFLKSGLNLTGNQIQGKYMFLQAYNQADT